MNTTSLDEHNISQNVRNIVESTEVAGRRPWSVADWVFLALPDDDSNVCPASWVNVVIVLFTLVDFFQESLWCFRSICYTSMISHHSQTHLLTFS